MVKKIGELTPERTTWIDGIYFAGFDSSDVANPDPKISLGSLRTAAAEFTNKTLGAGSTHSAVPGSSVNVGAAPGGTCVAAEYGNGILQKTVLTLTNFDVGDSADNAALALGALIYTLPAGVIVIEACHIAVGVTIDDAVQTDTPEIGVGNVVASGANATLGAAPAGSENVFEGTAMADVAGTVFTDTKGPTAGVPLILAAGDAHTLYLNLADTWADLTAAAELLASGTIVLLWRFVI